MTNPEQELRRTSLYETHKAAGAKMVPFAGYEMPVQYTGVIEEHRAVREAAGLFDVSHMGEFEAREESGALRSTQLVTKKAKPERWAAFRMRHVRGRPTRRSDLTAILPAWCDRAHWPIMGAMETNIRKDWEVEWFSPSREGNVAVRNVSAETLGPSPAGPAADPFLGKYSGGGRPRADCN